ncbi:MAG TPA: hypothetical protein VIQ23_09505 [Hanamia sp.]|jgi:hypothetical protein
MLENKRSAAPLLLAGLAAFAYYKYSKMTPEKKNDLKEKGKDLLDKYVPQPLKKFFKKGENAREQFV